MAKLRRMKTRDVAFQFRMGAGFPGDVNRTHPASIEPVQLDATNPPTLYGQLMLVDATSRNLRRFLAADQSDSTPVATYGMLVRPFPFQQSSGSNYGQADLGTSAPASGPADALRLGYGMVKVPAGQTPVKNGTVYVWCAASSGSHVQGGVEAVASAGNTVAVNNAFFNGPADASGNVEIYVK